MTRLFIVAKTDKPAVAAALEELRPWLAQRCEIVGVESNGQNTLADHDADVVLVLGGDGTLLSTARRLNGRPIPLLGVNFGRLGFLASFTPEQMKEGLEAFIRGQLPITNRSALQALVYPPGSTEPTFRATALNDAVITAGAPFHMIELELCVANEGGIRYFGDGVIVATPSGSTAYNVSAGGPIIDPNVDALCITPICPHSLSFRPVVVAGDAVVEILGMRLNEGTTLFCDGQASTPLKQGDRVLVSRSPNDVRLVENPRTRQWKSLADKLHWAATPRYTDRK
ncbi:MAG TPA: NAD(+)/NADH kinase [Tepidisphaeraceae bacterium]|jgi:NAD+ kinase|nr:NAD(+)/NADH kinase [Tepidisphaeraceae bacterium]